LILGLVDVTPPEILSEKRNFFNTGTDEQVGFIRAIRAILG